MKNKLIIILLIGAISTSLIACGSTSNKTIKDNDKTVEDTNQKESKEVDNTKIEEIKDEDTKSEENKSKNPLDQLKEEFKNKGFEVGENQELMYSMLGATNGYKFTLNGELIEIYYYDSKNLTDEQKSKYEQAKNGSVDMGGLNVPIVFKDDLALGRLENHPEKDKILEVFNNFKY